MKLPESITLETAEQLLTKARAGDKNSRDELILGYLRYAMQSAKNRSVTYSQDFISVAFMATVIAVDRAIEVKTIHVNSIRTRIRGALNRRSRTIGMIVIPEDVWRTGHRVQVEDLSGNEPELGRIDTKQVSMELNELIAACVKDELDSELVKALMAGMTVSQAAKVIGLSYTATSERRNNIRNRFKGYLNG